MSEKKSWLEKRTEWLENNKITGSILLVAFCVGACGGIISIVKEGIGFWQWLHKESDEIRVQVEIHNTRSNAVLIDPICQFEVIEIGRNSSTTHFDLGDSARLSPIGSFRGTNAYSLKPGEARNYWTRLPNNRVARDLMDKGATKIVVTVGSDAGDVKGEIPFSKDALRKQKALLGSVNEGSSFGWGTTLLPKHHEQTRTIPGRAAGACRERRCWHDARIQIARLIRSDRRHDRWRTVRATTGQVDRRHIDGAV